MGFRQTRTGRDWRLDEEHMARGGCECYLREFGGYHLTVENSMPGVHWCASVALHPEGEGYIDGEFLPTKRTAMAWCVEVVDELIAGRP